MKRNGSRRTGFKTTITRPKFRFAPRMGRRFWGPRHIPFSGRFAKESELKFHDVDLDDASISQAAQITASINLIPQGVTEVQRIGRKCTIRSINWRFDLEKQKVTAGDNTFETVRIILYLDKQANGATATVAQILETDDYQAFNNLSNKARFRTLMDRTYDLMNSSGGGDGTTEDYGATILHDSFYKKVNIPIEFDNTAGALTEIRSNNLGVLIISKVGAFVAFTSKFRLRFSDN